MATQVLSCASKSSPPFFVGAGQAYDSEGMPPYLPFSEAAHDYVRAAPLKSSPPSAQPADGPSCGAGKAPLPPVRECLPLPAWDAPGAAVRRLVFIRDDLHWAGQSSPLLLRHLARRLASAPLLHLRPTVILREHSRLRAFRQPRLRRLRAEIPGSQNIDETPQLADLEHPFMEFMERCTV
jgi:hypothetical protein